MLTVLLTGATSYIFWGGEWVAWIGKTISRRMERRKTPRHSQRPHFLRRDKCGKLLYEELRDPPTFSLASVGKKEAGWPGEKHLLIRWGDGGKKK